MIMDNATLSRVACIARMTEANPRYDWIACDDVSYCICVEDSYARMCLDMLTMRTRCMVRPFFTLLHLIYLRDFTCVRCIYTVCGCMFIYVPL